MWWRKPKYPQLTDQEFNEELERSISITRKVLEEPTAEYFPMLKVVLPDEIELITLFAEGEDDSIDDFDEFAASIGHELRKKRRAAPQAVFVFFPTENDNVVIHGATPDGRLNAAVIYLERDEEGHLSMTDSAIDPYPTDPFETHYARSVMSAYADPPRSGA